MARPSLSVITLNVNGLNFSIKSQRLAEWIFKKMWSNCILSTSDSRSKDTVGRKWKNGKDNLISQKVN